MSKEQSFIVTACSAITKMSIYVLVFLMPIFFLPWTFEVLDFNKQALLAGLAFLSFFCWMVKTLILGELKLSLSKVHIAIGVLFLTHVIATIVSVNRHGSFWGSAQQFSESLFSLICFLVVYLLVSNTFSEKEISHSFMLLSISAAIAFTYGILQIFGVHIVPLPFAQNNSFNTIGSRGGFGLFAAILLPLFIVFAMLSRSWRKILFIINIVLVFLVLALLNYSFLWWVLLVGAVLLLFFGIVKSDVLDGRWMFLPMFFLIISLFFIIFNPQLPFLPAQPFEISISHGATADISIQTIKNSPLFGSGPGTFIYDFAKYKDVSLNENILWNLNFYAGSSKFLTDLATVGILGLLATLAVIVLPIFYVVKNFMIKQSALVDKVPLIFAILIVVLVQVVGYSLYNSNLVLNFILFFSIASLVALTKDHSKIYQLKSSSVITLAITFAFTLVLIFGLGFLMLEGQRYVAEVYYYMGLKSFNEGDRQNGINQLKRAASNNSKSETYFNQLAVSSMIHLQNELANPSQNPENAEYKKMVQQLTTDSVNAVNVAISLNPNNVNNWSLKGNICQNLIGLIPDAATCAITAYDKAIVLSPVNPYLLLQEGNVYLAEVATLAQNQSQNKSSLLAKAKDKFNAALELKKNYSTAYIKLALVAGAQQNATAQSQALQNAINSAPNDVSVALQVGIFHYQNRNWDKAQAQFERALLLQPNYQEAMYYSGLTYAEQGQRDKAIAIFIQLVKANPKNEIIKKILNNLQLGNPALDGFGQAVEPVPPSSPTLPVTNPSGESSTTQGN